MYRAERAHRVVQLVVLLVEIRSCRVWMVTYRQELLRFLLKHWRSRILSERLHELSYEVCLEVGC